MDANQEASRVSTVQAADAAFFSPLPAPTHFFIVRHGRSEANARGIIQGRMDFPLDATGRAQAASVGSWLASEGLDRVLSSPLSRAAETARILASARGLSEPELCPELLECDTGIFSGLTWDELEALHPEVHELFRRSSWEGVPGAERAASLYERAMASWTIMRNAASGGFSRIACVTHAGFIQWLVKATYGCRAWMPLMETSNCGVFELYVEPSADSAFMQWRKLDFQASEKGS
jgi:broad specificity phosphatase PhoE